MKNNKMLGPEKQQLQSNFQFYDKLELIDIPKSVFFLCSFLCLLGLYWSSLNGGPLFDDYFYIFENNAVINDVPFSSIFYKFAWPISISAEKIFFSIWKDKYFYFRLMNLFLHFLNSYLLLKVVEKLQLPFSRLVFLLFLLHPSNVVCVGWMVQLKTLLCFTFCISSFFFLIRALEDKRYYGLSWVLFLLSTLSKAASPPLAVFFLAYSYKKKGKDQLIWLLPFLLISGYSSYRIMRSSFTSNAKAQLESKTYVGEMHGNYKDYKAIVKSQPKKVENDNGLIDRTENFLKTSFYYFWQVILPLDSPPVKGHSSESVVTKEIIHVIFCMAMVFLNVGDLAVFTLLAGYLMLMPFLGIINAPYMNLTLVSEQHLYLALPFFLIFWMGLLIKLKFKYTKFIPILFIIFFAIQTLNAVPYYESEIAFFSKSLESDYSNIPIAQNLAVSLVKNNEVEKAVILTRRMIELANKRSDMKESKYYPNLVILDSNLEEFSRKQRESMKQHVE